MDLGKPHLEGMRVLDDVAQMAVPLPAIFLASQVEVSAVVRAARQGVFAFLEKHRVNRTEILDAVQLVLKLDADKRIHDLRRIEVRDRFLRSSSIERQVLDLLLQGLALNTIAAELGVNRQTVANRRDQVIMKLGVGTFSSLVALVAEHESLGHSERC